MGDILERDVTPIRLAMHLQVAQRAQHHIELLHDMGRKPDGPRLIHDCALDRLADPPGGVGREAEAALGIELVERVNEPQVAFFDQVREREPSVGVVLCDADDEAQIVLDQRLPRGKIAGDHRPGERELLLRRQQHVLPDFVEIDLRDIVDDVRAEAGGWLRKRQFLRPPIPLGAGRGRLVVGDGLGRMVRAILRGREPRQLELGVVRHSLLWKAHGCSLALRAVPPRGTSPSLGRPCGRQICSLPLRAVPPRGTPPSLGRPCGRQVCSLALRAVPPRGTPPSLGRPCGRLMREGGSEADRPACLVGESRNGVSPDPRRCSPSRRSAGRG